MINLKLLTSILEQYKLSDEQAEELQKVIYKLDDGRLVELPCKVGDTVYINAWFGKAVPHVVKKIGSVYVQTDDARHQGGTADFYADDFEKSVFLTREEAEKALKEVKGNDKQ